MEKRVTLRDVAIRSGLSMTTVSMALRNNTKLTPKTRERVQNVAREMGYRSDPMLSALASRRWIGHTIQEGATLAVLADGEVEGLDGMVRQADALGYRIEVFQIGDYDTPARLANVLYSRGILGLVVAQIFKPGFCKAFDWSRFAAVGCGEGYECPPIHLVMPNHFKAVQKAWDQAWAAGGRRIGMALFDMPMAIDHHERCAAFMERQRQAAERDRIPIVVLNPGEGNAQHQHRNMIRALTAWLNQWQPDSILGFNAYFYWILKDCGWKVPQKVKFYDLWLWEESKFITPGLYLARAEQGKRAVDYLVNLIRNGERGMPECPVTLSISFTWREGPDQSKVQSGRSTTKGNRRYPGQPL